MKFILFALAIIVMLGIILLFLKLKVIITYDHEGEDDNFTILLKLLGFIKYEIKIPFIAIDDESASILYKEDKTSGLGEKEVKGKYTVQRLIHDMKQVERFLKQVIGFHTIVRKFLKKVSVNKFQWNTLIGIEDAALTGSITGVLWAIKGNVIGIISNYMKLKSNPKIGIEPNFQQTVLKTSFTCIVSFRIGYAILAGIKILRHWKKGRPMFTYSADQTVRRDLNV